jgi:hypothetical protein
MGSGTGIMVNDLYGVLKYRKQYSLPEKMMALFSFRFLYSKFKFVPAHAMNVYGRVDL